MHTLPDHLAALAAEAAARHPLPFSVAVDVAAVTALILRVNPAAPGRSAPPSRSPGLPLAA